MSRLPFVASVWVVLSALVLTGCLGGDGDAEPVGADGPKDEGSEAQGTTVTGQVRDDASLEAVVGANVSLVQGNEALKTTDTDQQGTYTFDGVAPGEYRIQVNIWTHHGDAMVIRVADEPVQANFMLRPFPNDKLFDESFDFRGLMTLGIHFVNKITCCTADPNHETSFNFTVSRPDLLRTIIVEVVWNDDTVGLHADLWKNPNCDPGCNPEHDYGEGNGFGNLSFRADHEMGDWPKLTADEEVLTVQMWPERGEEPATVAYQQEYHVYVKAFYVTPAQEGLVIRPDA